jgi:hypothetical protein
LDIPRRDVNKVSSSSYGLSLFSSNAGSHPEENGGVVPGESSSVSVGELCPGIDMLDGTGLEGISMVPVQEPLGGQMSHSHADPHGSRRKGEGRMCVDRRAPVDGAPGLSSTPSHGCGGDSTKNIAARILANASGAISPRMRRSFVDRQYSPSTGMDWSEWEIF